MASIILRPNGVGTITGWTDESGGTSNIWNSIDDDIGGVSVDTDYCYNSSGSTTRFFQFEDTPSNCDTITAATLKIRLRRTAKSGDYIYTDWVRIFESNESTALSNEVDVIDTTTFTNYETSLSLTGATTKAAWDGARIGIRTGTGSTGQVRVSSIELHLTYTETAGEPDEEYQASGGVVLGGVATYSTGSSLRVGLGAFWNLNETSGSRANSTFHANTLTDNNTVSYAVGKQSNGASFVSANNEYLSIADNSSINLASTDFSLSLWVKFDSLTNNGGNDYLGVMSKGSGGAAYAFSIQYRPSVSQLQIQFYNGGTTYTLWASTFGALSAGTWYHLIATYRDSNKATSISINGTENTGTSTVAVVDSSYGLSIGRAYFSNTYNSSCTIDSVGLWKKVLSSGEKTSLYLAGQGQEFPFESSNFKLSGSGGVVLGGTSSAHLRTGFHYSASGGVVLGGESTSRIRFSFLSFGGVVLGGESEINIEQRVGSGGVAVGGAGQFRNLYPCVGEGIVMPTVSILEMVSRIWTSIDEDVEVHIFTDIGPLEIDTEEDFITWQSFEKEKEEFFVHSIPDGTVFLDGGTSPDYSLDWDEEVFGESQIITGYAVVGATSRKVWWGNYWGPRTISQTNNSQFNVRLPVKREEVEA